MITPLNINIDPQEIITLDAEFAEGREMLELAAVDFEGNELMLQRFKPATLTEWNDVKIHGITPEMVCDCPSFASCVPTINNMILKARYVVGFAVAENDLAKMKREGVSGIDNLRILELRDWFWLCHGRDAGLDYSSHINLEKCCTELEIEAQDDDTHFHSAIFDTRSTLAAFRALLSRYIDTRPQLTDASFDTIFENFSQEFKEAKEIYDSDLSAGYAFITLQPNGLYKFRVNRQLPVKGNVIASIEVASRKKALLHFSQIFTGEIREKSFTFNKLGPKKLEEFKNYTNSFQGEEDRMAAKLMKLNKLWKK